MRSNYKKLGKYIREVNIRNASLKGGPLLGVSIQKVFMPSIANTIGTDMSTYKIVKKDQFAYGPVTSRNGDKISVALLRDHDEAIVSQAYTVFEVTDQKELLPEYLMMWFRRPEFDRYARYKSHGSAREIFSWDEMCEVELPVPPIEKQREIVKEYNVIVDRIRLNEQLNQRLEEAAQALYKHWFVDFEFPDENGKPYKSNGGAMEWIEELQQEIPNGWTAGNVEDLVQIIDGDRGVNYPCPKDFSPEGHCLFLNAGNVTQRGFNFETVSFISQHKDELLRKGKLRRNDIILTTRGTVGNVALYSSGIEYNDIRINSGMVILRPENEQVGSYCYLLFRSDHIQSIISNYLSGSAQPQLPIKDIKEILLLLPNREVIKYFYNLFNVIQTRIDLSNKDSRHSTHMKTILLARVSNPKLLEFAPAL